MKKLLLFAAYCLLLTGYSFSQTNLVPNPSFEDHISCPNSSSQTYLAVPWIQPTGHQGTSDYFHECCVSPIPFNAPPVGVPLNLLGNQEARTGEAYCGFFSIDGPTDGDYREYVQAPLTQPLTVGTRYCVRFYISLSDQSTNSTDGIGAYFSTTPVSGPGSLPLTFPAQVMSDTGVVITNSTGWEEIYGEFIADQSYAYITIGNFMVQGQTTIGAGPPIDTAQFPPALPLPGAYYYIEDVFVGEAATCPVPCNLQFTNGSTVADCNMSNGVAAINVTGGSGNYTYLWENGATTATLPGVAYGVYEVTVGDGPGCELSEEVFVGQNSSLSVTFNPAILQCASTPDGDIDIDVSGGTAPYTFLWSTGDTTEDIDSIPGGVYSVVVTDADGCMLTDSTELTSFFASESVVTVTNESCAGANNGSIYVTPGGIFPFPPAYLWNTGATTAGIYNLAPGNYWVQTTDFFGCVDTLFATVGSGTGSFNVNISQQADTLYATTAPNYQWYLNGVAIPGATQQIIIIEESGNYYCVSNGGGNCVDTSNIVEATCLCLSSINEMSLLENVLVYPNPANDVLNVNFGFRIEDCELKIINSIGQVIHQSEIQNSQSAINIAGLSEGIYIVRISTPAAQRHIKLLVRK